MPPVVFDRNLHRAPLPVRTADIMWGMAGISSMRDGCTVSIPTSVYSLPMVLVREVGGWDCGPGAIGEDLHMYLKCFFALSGNLTVRVIHAAASQCNVGSDASGIRGYLDRFSARYKQALRHMWGSLDTGFAVRAAISMVSRSFDEPFPSQERHFDSARYAPITYLLQSISLLTAGVQIKHRIRTNGGHGTETFTGFEHSRSNTIIRPERHR